VHGFAVAAHLLFTFGTTLGLFLAIGRKSPRRHIGEFCSLRSHC
jgi:hypothetical protein